MTGETGDPKRAISIEAPTLSAHFSASKLFRRRDGKRLDPFRRRPTRDREVSEEFPFIYCHPNLCGTIVWPLLKSSPRFIASHCGLPGKQLALPPSLTVEVPE